MIKDLSEMSLMMAFVYNQNVLPYCFTYTKPVCKSIDRYWYKINKVRRKKEQWKKLKSKFTLEDILKDMR